MADCTKGSDGEDDMDAPGIPVQKKKKGGKVVKAHGKKSKHRLDKMARGDHSDHKRK